MKIANNTIYLEDSKRFDPLVDSINYTDLSGNRVNIPIKDYMKELRGIMKKEALIGKNIVVIYLRKIWLKMRQ